ncbi:MAG: cold shock domain-containing protein [Oligoflexia bacterium]|nr:cold shock domain-containing protein [Oligoflexia bacterium]
MLVKGKITILIDNELEFGEKMQYGFVQVKDMEEDIFFNTLTSFENTVFEDLKIGDKVHVLVKQTKQGPLAESLTLSSSRHQEETYSLPPSPSL